MSLRPFALNLSSCSWLKSPTASVFVRVYYMFMHALLAKKVQILVLPEIADSGGYLFEVVAVQRKEGERSTFRELLQDLVVCTFDSEVRGLVRAETGCGV